MATSVCLRCEWGGSPPASGRCPRCGIRLFEHDLGAPPASRAPAPVSTARLEAEVLEREQEEAAAPSRPSRRRWIAPVALAVVGAAILLLPRQEASRPQRPGVANPRPPAIRFIALPEGLSDRTVDRPLRIAFVATQPMPEDRALLSQLWRLDLPTGELTPGPIVGDVVAMRYVPTEARRLAFLESDGSLYVLDGFLASRPAWVDEGVSAFDFTRDGVLVYAKVERRSVPTGGAAAFVRIGHVEPDRSSPSNAQSRVIPRLNLRGFTVRGWRLIAWGVRGGRERAVVWDGRAGGVRPAPSVRLTPRARSAAGYWELGSRGVQLISRAIPGDPAHLAVSGELAIWAGEDGLAVGERDGGRSFIVELPTRFPTPTGPVAAAEGR